MNESDNDLLRRFAKERSEDAFSELVARHLGLVYSAALRQVEGNASAAEEIAQAVFTDLARKASRLTSHSSLTGWLYTGTRHLAANQCRADQRRYHRERQAHTMNQLLHDSGPEVDWSELGPVLDDAMHELSEADREALLLRYFERRPLAEVGTRLGLGENAARMRVDRALERLRQALRRRGVTSIGAALSLALAERAVAGAPAGLAAKIAPVAMAAAGAGVVTGGGILFTLLSVMTRNQIKVVVGAALLALLVVPFTSSRFGPGSRTGDAQRAEGRAVTVANATTSSIVAASSADLGTASTASSTNEAIRRLKLRLVAADSGLPIPGAEVQRGWVTEATFVSLRDGTVPVTFPRSTKELRLTTRVEGFADTCLKWSLERGETVPESYTLKLERAVELGGTVVDPDGKPLSGAKISFGHTPDPTLAGRVETHEFAYLETASDEQGRWRLHRIAEDMLRTTGASAKHPEHTQARVELGSDPGAEKAMRAGSYVFRLGRGVTVTGVVVDPDGSPVIGATVLVGMVSETNSRQGKTDETGQFSVRGCLPGKQLLSAQAQGFSATTEEVELKPGAGPFRLVLGRGTTLRLRVVSQNGKPVQKATLWLETTEGHWMGPADREPGGNKRGAVAVQTELELHTDADGRANWSEAPDSDLSFSVAAPGHMYFHHYRVHPDGQEHTVTLEPALTIVGTVVDSKTGALVPKARIITGWPQKDFFTGKTNAQWSPIDRFWLPFEGGAFQHTFEEAVLGAEKNPGYVFKFEAEGYASYISRFVAADEGEVRLDVSLRPAASTTITVVTPDGRPATGAGIALVPTDGHARLKDGGFDPLNSRGSLILTTDSRGQFKLPADDSLGRILATHPGGFGEVAPGELNAGRSTWQLLPWGRIEGKWLVSGKPAVGNEVLLENPDGPMGMLEFDFSDSKKQTDSEGRFAYERVPPGTVRLVRLIQSPGGNGWGHGRKTEVVVRPGEISTVTLGVGGYVVTASLVLPAGVDPSQRVNYYGVIQTPTPEIPTEIKGNPEAIQRWLQASGRFQLMQKAKVFPLTSEADGLIRGEEVEPGTFVFRCGAFVADATGKPLMRWVAPTQPITIPDSPSSGTIDLGVITLQPEPAPR